MMAGLNPFDLRSVLSARHAQHVVLIHFPIALFICGVAFDRAGQWANNHRLLNAAHYNLLLSAISTAPAGVSGFLAWRFQLEGQKLKGLLLLHLIFGCVSILLIWLVWWLHQRAWRKAVALPAYGVALEFVAAVLVALTGHLGGFLSGVNMPS